MSLPAFWIDRYEVTNGEFKKFVDAGGYQKPEYWTTAFIKDGKTLSFAGSDGGVSGRHGQTGPGRRGSWVPFQTGLSAFR